LGTGFFSNMEYGRPRLCQIARDSRGRLCAKARNRSGQPGVAVLHILKQPLGGHPGRHDAGRGQAGDPGAGDFGQLEQFGDGFARRGGIER